MSRGILLLKVQQVVGCAKFAGFDAVGFSLVEPAAAIGEVTETVRLSGFQFEGKAKRAILEGIHCTFHWIPAVKIAQHGYLTGAGRFFLANFEAHLANGLALQKLLLNAHAFLFRLCIRLFAIKRGKNTPVIVLRKVLEY